MLDMYAHQVIEELVELQHFPKVFNPKIIDTFIRGIQNSHKFYFGEIVPIAKMFKHDAMANFPFKETD